MNASSDPELVRRLVELDLERRRRAAGRIEEFDWGRLILTPEASAIWSANFLEVDADGLDADQLIELADEQLGARGMDHRLIVPRDPERAAELEPRFRELGWKQDVSLYMVRRRDPERPGGETAEVSRAAVEGVRLAVAEADPDFSRDAIEQIPVRDARLDAVGNARWFAAPATGEPAASCALYELEGVGQVETVETRPERRGQGLASAVVLAAAEASRQAGHELTFIVADADDWPWKLYERLGFDPIGEHRSFLRKPGQATGG
jgi:ribosomal protein S18 acetylase RimI-like enzyme